MANQTARQIPGVQQLEALYGFFEDVAEKLSAVQAALALPGSVAMPAVRVLEAQARTTGKDRNRLAANIRYHRKSLTAAEYRQVKRLWADGRLNEAAELASRIIKERKIGRASTDKAGRKVSPALRRIWATNANYMRSQVGLSAADRNKVKKTRIAEGMIAALRKAAELRKSGRQEKAK